MVIKKRKRQNLTDLEKIKIDEEADKLASKDLAVTGQNMSMMGSSLISIVFLIAGLIITFTGNIFLGVILVLIGMVVGTMTNSFQKSRDELKVKKKEEIKHNLEKKTLLGSK